MAFVNRAGGDGPGRRATKTSPSYDGNNYDDGNDHESAEYDNHGGGGGAHSGSDSRSETKEVVLAWGVREATVDHRRCKRESSRIGG